ncbi:MAG: winged helix-turn-helix transcriptional regulator, partial [Bacteroidetes bacterium]|nr:winged helix-turn-helix transcriptional regulator [Bacteroidota bacterium]
MSRHQGLSYPEIANKLGVTVGTVKTQMSRA